jgi:cytochrome c
MIAAMAGIAVSTFGPQARASQNEPPGVTLSYTEAQSTRGEASYTKLCGPCHDDKSMAPPVQGDAFLTNWSDKSVRTLFEKIQVTMPLNDPGSLSDQQAVDLVAYVLKLNSVPAGDQALPTDPAILGALTFSGK